MFHSFDYPDETGSPILGANFWRPLMVDGVINFPRPEQCTVKKEIREMTAKVFSPAKNFREVDAEAEAVGV